MCWGTVTMRLKAWAARCPVACLAEFFLSLDLDLLEGEGLGVRETKEPPLLEAPSTPSLSMLFSKLGAVDTWPGKKAGNRDLTEVVVDGGYWNLCVFTFFSGVGDTAAL